MKLELRNSLHFARRPVYYSADIYVFTTFCPFFLCSSTFWQLLEYMSPSSCIVSNSGKSNTTQVKTKLNRCAERTHGLLLDKFSHKCNFYWNTKERKYSLWNGHVFSAGEVGKPNKKRRVRMKRDIAINKTRPHKMPTIRNSRPAVLCPTTRSHPVASRSQASLLPLISRR